MPLISQAASWVVTDGIPGVENQCLGLAAALGLTPEIKRIKMRAPWRQLAPLLVCGAACAFSDEGDRMDAPWPDILIASGRQSILASLYVARESRRGGKRGTFTIQIQNPRIDPARFNAVVTPRHDQLSGANVISPLGSLHRVTPALLAEEAAKLAPRVAALPGRKIGVLIGGSNAVYRLTPDLMRTLAGQLRQLAGQGYGLMITTSRRTGKENEQILRTALADAPVFIWDGQGANPYFGILGLAEALLVTGDSVNMVSEACAAGKPVMLLPLEGDGSAKFRRFHAAFEQGGYTRPFRGSIENWAVPAFDEVGDTARRIAEMYASFVSGPARGGAH